METWRCIENGCKWKLLPRESIEEDMMDNGLQHVMLLEKETHSMSSWTYLTMQRRNLGGYMKHKRLFQLLNLVDIAFINQLLSCN
jgi:hypothetical protein